MTEASISAKGLDGIVVGDTELSLVDGLKGILVYRGYNIDELADCSMEQVCHLFLYGDLPNDRQLASIKESLSSRYEVPEAVLSFINKAPQNDHPMAILRTGVSMLSGYIPAPNLQNVPENIMLDTALHLIAKTGTIAATICRTRQGLPALKPDPSLGFSANFLRLCTGSVPEEIVIKTMDTALVLHMDHGFNASTFTARVITSSLSDMVSAVTGAIGSLKGPLHGGANAAVMAMLQEIGDIKNVEAWLDKALREKRKVMGFGHRVYKVMDPRAKHLKRMSKEWGERSHDTKWFQMSERLEKLMLEKKHLNANVDFYSASTYFTMGIKPEMYTLLFAVARMVGWTAHVMEQLKDNRIVRPESHYIGPMGKKYVH